MLCGCWMKSGGWRATYLKSTLTDSSSLHPVKKKKKKRPRTPFRQQKPKPAVHQMFSCPLISF